MFKETLVVTSMGKNCVSLSNSNGLSIDYGFCSTHTSTEDVDVIQKYHKFYFGENAIIEFAKLINEAEELESKVYSNKTYQLTSIDNDKFGIATASFERKDPNQGIYSIVIKAPICWFKDHFEKINMDFKLNINQII